MSPNRPASTQDHKSKPEHSAVLEAAQKAVHVINTSVRPYWRQIAIAVGVVVVVVALSSAISASRASRIARGFAALQAAEEVQELIDVAEQFAGTIPGSQASLAAARKLYEEGKYDQAATRFALVLQDHAESPLAEAARFGEAYSLEAEKKFQAAQKRFDSLADEAEEPTKIVDACLGAARCAKAQGKYAEAEKRIQTAVDSGVEGVLESRAKEALKALKSAQIERPAVEVPAAEIEAAATPAEPVEPKKTEAAGSK